MNKEALTITPVSPEDSEELCKIAVQAWQGIHDGYREMINDDDLYSRISANWQQKKAASIAQKIAEQPDEVIVARDASGNILGFATFTIDKERGLGDIGNNAVRPECQGQGVGKALYNRVIEIFKEHGLAYATVSTGYEDRGHAKARAAYEKVGFKKMRTSITYSLKLT